MNLFYIQCVFVKVTNGICRTGKLVFFHMNDSIVKDADCIHIAIARGENFHYSPTTDNPQSYSKNGQIARIVRFIFASPLNISAWKCRSSLFDIYKHYNNILKMFFQV